MEIEIRESTHDDRENLKTLIEALHMHVVKMDPIQRIRMMPGFDESTIAEFEDAQRDNEGKCYLAISTGGEIIGYIAGLIAKQSEKNLLSVVPTRLGVINDLYVKPEFRNHQIGTKLIEHMENYFKQKECDSVWLEVFDPNVKAHEFYKRHGYVDREINMLKKL